jgi:predicted adenine nucleotide alpha hydrolase (AANH) superfamily ATPase
MNEINANSDISDKNSIGGNIACGAGRLLLHTCCGPCAAWPLVALREQRFDVAGLFYNPNIHPESEFYRRSESAARIYEIAGAPLMLCDAYMRREWEIFEENSKNCINDPLSNPRCAMCYRTRLSYTASRAKAMGFDMFSTTLLISPYQNHDLIAAICEEQSKIHGVRFYYSDFRPHFRKGQQLARESGLYMQKYCGCIFSAPKN